MAAIEGIDFLYQYATSAMDDELLAQSFIPAAPVYCSCCNRCSIDWPRPEAVSSRIYQRDIIHCVPCYSLFHGSRRYLGVERGTGEHAVAGKLGMLQTCALLVTATKVIIFTGENYAEKLSAAQTPFFSLQIATGFAQILALFDLNPEPPFLFISDLGRKKEALVANLRVTSDVRRWFICSAKELSTLMPRAVKELFDAIRQHQLPEAVVLQWLDVLWKVATGGIAADDRKVQELSTQLPEFRRDILPLFPQDPYQRIDSVRIVRKWLESTHDRV